MGIIKAAEDGVLSRSWSAHTGEVIFHTLSRASVETGSEWHQPLSSSSSSCIIFLDYQTCHSSPFSVTYPPLISIAVKSTRNTLCNTDF